MNKVLYGEKVALLAANGFCEQDMTALQRALVEAGANVRVVAMEQGLINGWDGHGWGLNFAVDCALNEALAGDFAMLAIPGGSRSVEKLKLTGHTKRFIGGFIDTGKPVAVFGDALDLLIFTEKVVGRTVTGPETLQAAAETAGALWKKDGLVVDANLISGGADPAKRKEYAAAAVSHFARSARHIRAAA